MKKLGNIWRKHSLWSMFLIIIFVGGTGTLPALYAAAKAQYASRTLDTSVAEAEYEDNFWHHSELVAIRGGVGEDIGRKAYQRSLERNGRKTLSDG